jgi:(2R)-3-sulfolactate dehydrogenase (NADP+)
MSTIAVDELETLMRAALVRSGATHSMALATARALAFAEMEGLASHGASRIPQYCGHVKNGRADGAAVPVVARDARAACLVDAKGGLAFEACGLAVREAVRRAREFGVSFVSVTNSNHFGVAAYHLDPVAEAGRVGIAFGTSPAAMPAWGGRRALFGTNPVAAVFPRRSAPPLVIDVSLSAVARGKIMVAARDGKPTRIGQGFLAVDPDALAGREVFLERVETLVAAMLEDPGVRLPGARRLEQREKVRAAGVNVPDELLARIRALASDA